MFLGLLKKDFLLIKNFMWVLLAVILALYLGGLALLNYNGIPEMIFMVLFFLYFMHIIVLPGALTILLKAEEKGHYWLHGTAGATRLLLSKLILSFAVFLASLILTDILALISLLSIPGSELIEFNFESRIPFKEGFLINGGIMATTTYLTAWGIFFWSFYHSLNGYPVLKKLRWPLMIGIYILAAVVANSIVKLTIVQKLFSLWIINLTDTEGVAWSFGNASFTIQNGDLPVIPLILYFLFQVVLFLAAKWLLERKVEV